MREPSRVALAYTTDSRWRNRSEFLQGRDEITSFLERKWQREREYRLTKALWAFHEDRIAVRFAYEWQDQHGRSEEHTSELQSLMRSTYAVFCLKTKKQHIHTNQ